MVQETRVLMLAYDFRPGEDFDVIAELETTNTVKLLQTADGETIPEITQPDEYTGHVIRTEGEATANPTLLFTRGQEMSEGDTLTISDSLSIFSTDLNLIETSLE